MSSRNCMRGLEMVCGRHRLSPSIDLVSITLLSARSRPRLRASMVPILRRRGIPEFKNI